MRNFNVYLFVLCFSFASTHLGAEKKEEAKGFEVQPKSFAIPLFIEGMFEPREKWELSIKTETWKSLRVLKAVKHASYVARGEVLIELDTRQIDQTIVALKNELLGIEIDLEKLGEELNLMKESNRIESSSLRRQKKIASENLSIFEETLGVLAQKKADFSVKNSENALVYAKEELSQLKKMYEEDNLTEESEGIILKRQKDVVARRIFRLEETKINRNEKIKRALPREKKGLEENFLRKELAEKKSTASFSSNLKLKKLALRKKEVELVNKKNHLASLTRDRQAMELKSPADGLIYYGKFSRGTWAGQEVLGEGDFIGAEVKPYQVLMSLIQNKDLVFSALLPESDLLLIQGQAQGLVVPKAYPTEKDTCHFRVGQLLSC